jgi:DNA-binding CsgD family transcriptional regulator
MEQFRPDLLSRLSDRQRQCLDLVADGLTSKEIGRRLSLSPSTVDNHIRSALERLNVTDRSVAARAVRQSWNTENDSASPDIGATAERAGVAQLSLLQFPPLGGAVNRLSAYVRIWHIVQIALIGIMGMAAAVLTIAGLVGLFRP